MCRGWTRAAVSLDDPAPWRCDDGNFYADLPDYLGDLQEADALYILLRDCDPELMRKGGEFDAYKAQFGATFFEALFLAAIAFSLQVRDPLLNVEVIGFDSTPGDSRA